MNNKNGDGSEKKIPIWRKPVTRRGFLIGATVGGAGALLAMATNGVVGKTKNGRTVFAAQAEGMIIGDPSRCVGCRRCELACSEYNDGVAQPSIARIKVGRNYNFGPKGVQIGFWRGAGRFGDHLIVQDTCRQCPHPVPCLLACPYDAIEVSGPVNARVINQDKCRGCRTCQRACPWGMTSFNEETRKATKCHLCNGDPQCVKACPAGAIKYVPWLDRTKDLPGAYVVPAFIETREDVKKTCVQCH